MLPSQTQPITHQYTLKPFPLCSSLNYTGRTLWFYSQAYECVFMLTELWMCFHLSSSEETSRWVLSYQTTYCSQCVMMWASGISLQWIMRNHFYIQRYFLSYGHFWPCKVLEMNIISWFSNYVSVNTMIWSS